MNFISNKNQKATTNILIFAVINKTIGYKANSVRIL